MSVATTLQRHVDRIDIVRLGQLLVPVVLVIIWQLLATVASGLAFAGPADTLDAFISGIKAGWLVSGLRRTLTELVVAYMLAIVAGVCVGVSLGTSDFWKDVFEPILIGTYSIPKVTLFPLFLFVFQLGMDSKIAFGWFHGIFPIAILTMSAMATINEEHLKLARSLQLSRWQTFKEVTVPSILPGLIIGLRLGFNLTFLGIILGEMFAARAGLGYTLVEFIAGGQTARIMAIIIALVIAAAVVNIGFFAIESKFGERGRTTDVRM